MKEQINEVLSSGYHFLIDNYVVACAGMIVIILTAFALREYHHYRNWKHIAEYIPKPKHKSLMRGRAAFVRELVAYRLHFALEKDVYDGVLTRHEVNHEYRRLAMKSKNHFILPPTRQLKQQLAAKAEAKKLHPPDISAARVLSVVGGQVVAFGSKSLRRRQK